MNKTSPWEDGPDDAQLLILGESPGTTELKLELPFCGPSGELLDWACHENGIIRRELKILNCFQCRVRKDEKTGSIYNTSGQVLYTNKEGFIGEGKRHLEYLSTRINSMPNLNCILGLGAVALRALNTNDRETSIMKYRGSLGWSKRFDRKYCTAVHPSFIIRGNDIYRHVLKADLKRAYDESATHDLNLPNPSLIIDPTFEEAVEYLRLCQTKKEIATDIECFNRQVSCFSIAHTIDEAMSIPLVWDNNPRRWSPEQEAAIWIEYAKIISNPKIIKTNQNIGFDLRFLLCNNNIIPQGKLNDPMIAFSILYPTVNKVGQRKREQFYPKSLAFISSIWTRHPFYKDDGKMWKTPWRDVHNFARYSARDSVVALECWFGLKEELLEKNLLELHDWTTECIYPIMYMETRGIKVDHDNLKGINDQLSGEIHTLEQELNEEVGYELNALSSKQCNQHFYGLKGITPYKSRSTGNATTDETALIRILRKHDLKETRIILDIRNRVKLQGTYTGIAFDPDNRFHTSFDPRGTRFGRFSSSKTLHGTGQNQQNLDTRFRRYLICD